MDKESWQNELKAFIAEQRALKPVPSRDSLSLEEEWQCRIIGGEFLGWQNRDLQHIMGQRHVLAKVRDFDPDPLFVLSTHLPGLVALTEIVPEPPSNLLYLLHDEFTAWEAEHPAIPFNFHIHHWSFFKALDSELQQRAEAEFPEIAPQAFRRHQTGDLWGEQCGVMADHLWQWTGRELGLLEEAFDQAQY